MAPRTRGKASPVVNGNKASVKQELSGDVHHEAEDQPNIDVELDRAADSQDPPLLPMELLQSVPGDGEPSDANRQSSEPVSSETDEKLLMKQLWKSTRGTGVLKAGEAAQTRRGVPLMTERVKHGRVGKKRKTTTKPQVSGKQRIMEDRKRVASNGSSGQLPAKRRTKKAS